MNKTEIFGYFLGVVGGFCIAFAFDLPKNLLAIVGIVCFIVSWDFISNVKHGGEE